MTSTHPEPPRPQRQHRANPPPNPRLQHANPRATHRRPREPPSNRIEPWKHSKSTSPPDCEASQRERPAPTVSTTWRAHFAAAASSRLGELRRRSAAAHPRALLKTGRPRLANLQPAHRPSMPPCPRPPRRHARPPAVASRRAARNGLRISATSCVWASCARMACRQCRRPRGANVDALQCRASKTHARGRGRTRRRPTSRPAASESR